MLLIPFDARLDRDVLYHIYGSSASDISAISHAEFMFSDYVDNMDTYLKQLVDSAQTGDYETGRIISHNLQTKMLGVGLSVLEKPLVDVEHLYKVNENSTIIIALVEKFCTLEKEYRQIIVEQHTCLQEFLSLR